MAIRYGSQTVDPVTEVLAAVVGARLDVSRKKVVPVTSFYWLMMADQTDNIQVGQQRERRVTINEARLNIILQYIV